MNVCPITVKPGTINGKLKTGNLTLDSVKLSWLPPLDDGGSPITRYVLEVRQQGSRDWNTLIELPKTVNEFTVKDLIEGEEYSFRVSAENSVGQGKPVEVDAPIKPERKPGMFCLSKGPVNHKLFA